jgi:hypothetical protein
LTGQPEGFVQNGRLVPGRPTQHTLKTGLPCSS